MTVSEFSEELDIIYENINKNGAPGLDPYEKSVILTHAQEFLVSSVLEQKEPAGDRFPELITIFTSGSPSITVGLDGGYVFTGPTKILKILNEKVVSTTKEYVVLPISNEQYQVKKSKAYAYPSRRRAWRMGVANPTDVASVEIFPRFGVVLTNYTVRYIKKPDPIVLVDLTSLTPSISTIDGITALTECKLDEGLHREILKIAVGLAEQYYLDKYGTGDNK